MILQNRAYVGKQYVYRAYHKNKIIWDHGDYVNGVAAGVLDGSAMPKPVDPTPIQLHAEATAPGSGIPHTMELLSIMAHTDAVMEAEGNANAAQTIRISGKAEADLHAVGAPSTYSQVFAAAQAECELSAQAAPSAAGISYGVGIADASIIASLCPTVAEFLQLLVAAGATIDGSSVPLAQEPEKITASTAAELATICAPVAMPVHTVTFMCNGVELFKTKVVEGYDCNDPVTAGDVETPTKEMTAQYTFEFAGWSLTEYGEVDENALSNITRDTVVYAAFTKSIRYYDIKFYDGGTLLKTLSFAYGETPSYTAVKAGYISEGWTPEPVPVTEETHYTAVWKQVSAFANASWDDIAKVAESGHAADFFAVGDIKTIEFNNNGETYSVQFFIADFNHDTTEDGGTAGITLMSYYVLTGSTVGQTSDHNIRKYTGWRDSSLRSTLNSKTLTFLPEDLVPHIKSVRKLSSAANNPGALETTIDKLFIPSITEYGKTQRYTCAGQGTKYQKPSGSFCAQNKGSIATSVGTSDYIGTRSNSNYGTNFVTAIRSYTGATTYTGYPESDKYNMCFCI